MYIKEGLILSKNFIHTHKTLSFLLFIALIYVLVMTIHSPKRFTQKTANKTLPLVVATKASIQDVPVFLNALGTVTPDETITVKTQINGQLIKVLFKEGQTVKKGELLAQIDPRPYQALLIQYQGQLARDQAILENAKQDLSRYELLWKQDSIAKQTFDTQKLLVKQYEGAVQTDLGLIQAAKLNLVYCDITSPINARVGFKLVDAGNFVQTSDANGLFVLNKVKPVSIVFTVPEDNVISIFNTFQKNKKMLVEVYNRTQSNRLGIGFLDSVDNQIDTTTGTIKLKAQFNNEEDELFPNQFVNVKIQTDLLKDAIVIPTSAVQYGVKNYVYVYNQEKKTVHFTPITPSVNWGDYTVITAGLNKEDWVITEGTDKLTDGLNVTLFKDSLKELESEKS